MNKKLIIICAISGIAMSSCVLHPERGKPPFFLLTTMSNDPEYGKTESKPVKVGGINEAGHRNQYWFFKMLRGPNGEMLEISRIGHCCGFNAPNGYKGTGLLDKWKIDIPSTGETFVLYLNSYEFENPLIPVGFTSHQIKTGSEPPPKNAN